MKIAVFDPASGVIMSLFTSAHDDDIGAILTKASEDGHIARVLDGTPFHELSRTRLLDDDCQPQPTLTLEQFNAAHPSTPA